MGVRVDAQLLFTTNYDPNYLDLTQAFPFDILKKNSRRKKLKTQGKNSITQEKNSRFCQLCFQNSYILITFAIIWVCFLLMKDNSVSKFSFSSKTQQNSIQFVQKLKYFLKTQGKNSFFWQVHYPALPKSGRKEKPVLNSISICSISNA